MYHLKYIMDRKLISGSYINGVKVIHSFDLNKIEAYDIVISSTKIVDEMILQLRKLNIKNRVFVVPDYTYKFLWNKNYMDWRIELDINKPFVFTLYPETGRKKRVIEQRLGKYNVECVFTPPVYEFRKGLEKENL